MKKLISLFVALFVLLCPFLQAQTWNTPIIVTPPYSGIGGIFGSSKLLVVNGYPAMVVRAAPQNHLVFFHATDIAGTTWGPPIPIDVSGKVDGNISFQIVNGNPAISYDVTGSDGNDLRYVRATDANGTIWSSPITIEATGNVGQYSSLQEVKGNPAISYYDGTNSSLKYVRATDANGSTWGSPLVLDANNVTGQYTSLQVVDGNPAVAYLYYTNGTLKYVRATDTIGTAWNAPVSVDAFGGGDYCTLQIVNGFPAIAYYRGYAFGDSYYDLKFIRATDVSGTSWGSPLTIDSIGHVGLYTSLHIVNNNPAISYYDQTNSSLKYIRASNVSGTAWGAPLIIDAQGSLSSLQIVNGNPAISYQSGNSMKYIRSNDISGNIWATPIPFNNTGVVGLYASLKAINGVPAISYYSILFNGGLLYDHAADNSGTTWETPVFADGFSKGKYSSLLEVNGNPAVVYYDETFAPYKIRFRRASSAGGTIWASSVIIDNDIGSTVTDIPTRISMQIVNGNPAIVYFDNSGGSGLKYARATDVNGAAWASPITIKSGQATNISMQIVNGSPAIIYHDGADLQYVRATDINGTTWSAPVTIDTYNPGGNWFKANYSLEIVAGNPAVSYTNGSTLKYVRATDNNGTGWAAPVILDPTVFVNYFTSMQVVNGNPSISYYDETKRDLKYVRATDVSGAAWAEPVSLDTAGDVGAYASMAIINGNPAIAYYDGSQGLLRFISSTNFVSLCQGGNTSLSSSIAGATYQWQLNTGSSFVNINDNSNYTGTNTINLQLNNIPSSWYGYQYRCVVDGINSYAYAIRFVNNWIGSVSTAWENSANWSCGVIPDGNTDVLINNGTVIVNSSGSCRTLTVGPGTNFTVHTGFNLTITH